MRPEPNTPSLASLVNDIETGQLKIPQFQRDFVWIKAASAHLLDSIIKGYPIGTFIFWRTRERLRSIKEIGGLQLQSPQEGEAISFVLDGQQRLTSLYATIKGAKIQRNGKVEDFGQIYVDLEASEDENIVIHELNGRVEGENAIKVTDLLFGGLKTKASFPEKYHEKLDKYSNKINTYPFQSTTIRDAEMSVATEVFTRINVTGKQLTLYEIIVAKTYSEDPPFDLHEKVSALKETLSEVEYETISEMPIIQTISLILKQDCTRQTILNIKKEEIIQIWPMAADAIQTSTDYFRSFFKIGVSKLLPYNTLIIPFSYFFFLNGGKNPSPEQEALLQDFFWRASLTARYSSSVESKLAQDAKKMEAIVNGIQPKYEIEFAVDISPKYIIDNGWFSTNRSFIKAILCLYSFQGPLRLNNGGAVLLNNDWLKQSNSKNYHHFFPRAFIEKQKNKDDLYWANHVLNITFVDDYLNKRVIKAKAPSKYMKDFLKSNKHMPQTLASHLIDDLESYGVMSDDYNTFIEKRALAVNRELSKRILPQQVDRNGEVELPDDVIPEEEMDFAAFES